MVCVLTANELPEIQAIGGRVTGILDLLKMFRDLNIDMSGILKLVELLNQITLADSTRGKVVAALELLKVASAATQNTTDDKIVSAISTILAGPLLDMLCNMIDAWLGSKSLALDAIEADVSAQGFDWSAFMQIAQLVLALLRERQK